MNKLIQVFNRHCYSSDVSKTKKRPEWFSREICFENLWQTAESNLVDFHFIFDEAKGQINDHFLNKFTNSTGKGCSLKIINTGKEAQAFLQAIDYIMSYNFDDNQVIYIVEDDYLHRPNWCQALLEGFELKADYVTLFDHADKYSSMYPELVSQIVIGKLSHWRTTPSTTNTYAMKVRTLKQDIEIHKFYSKGVNVSLDHQKFIALEKKGRKLLSPIPAYSTHADVPWTSPIIEWEKYI